MTKCWGKVKKIENVRPVKILFFNLAREQKSLATPGII